MGRSAFLCLCLLSASCSGFASCTQDGPACASGQDTATLLQSTVRLADALAERGEQSGDELDVEGENSGEESENQQEQGGEAIQSLIEAEVSDIEGGEAGEDELAHDQMDITGDEDADALAERGRTSSKKSRTAKEKTWGEEQGGGEIESLLEAEVRDIEGGEGEDEDELAPNQMDITGDEDEEDVDEDEAEEDEDDVAHNRMDIGDEEGKEDEDIGEDDDEQLGRQRQRGRSERRPTKGGLIKAKHGKCLDASQRSRNGGKVHMWRCNANNKNQQWTYNAATGQIKATHGKCLDASQRNRNGGKVHMWNCNTNNKNQQWAISGAGGKGCR